MKEIELLNFDLKRAEEKLTSMENIVKNEHKAKLFMLEVVDSNGEPK